MKIIALRGLPGSGKSFIAEKLVEQLGGLNICVDGFKVDFLEQNPNTALSEALEYSYKKALDQVVEYFNNETKIVIIEEIFNDNYFVKKLNDFCAKNNITISWFYIKRDLEKLLEAEKNRDRKVKNTRENLLELQKEIESVEIKKETVIKNNTNIDDALEMIINKI